MSADEVKRVYHTYLNALEKALLKKAEKEDDFELAYALVELSIARDQVQLLRLGTTLTGIKLDITDDALSDVEVWGLPEAVLPLITELDN